MKVELLGVDTLPKVVDWAFFACQMSDIMRMFLLSIIIVSEEEDRVSQQSTQEK